MAESENYLDKDKSLAQKRRNDIVKALRKMAICRKAYRFDWYDNLHQYSKNKIHCSCPMCSAKTNNKKYKSRGPMSTRGSRIATTGYRYGKKYYKVSEIRKIDSMRYSEG